MGLYIDENLPTFLLSSISALIFLIFTIVFLNSYLKRNRSLISLAYMSGTLCIVINWGTYAIRCAFFPGNAEWFIVRFFWFLAYTFGGFALIFFATASLLFTQKPDTEKRVKSVLLVLTTMILIGFILVLLAAFELYDMLELQPTEFIEGLIDAEAPLFLQIYFAFFLLFTLSLANGSYIYFLIKADKNTANYTRVIWLEVGLALLSIGYLIEGLKPAIFLLIILGRTLISTGGFLMLYGFQWGRKKQ